MLKNISIRTAIVGAILFAPSMAVAGRTQIIVQWVDGPKSLSSFGVLRVQGILDGHASAIGYDSDGNDVGSGTQNFYLYADDRRVNEVANRLIALRNSGELPDGMRIGAAVYKDSKRKDWSYRPLYPSTLKHFDITYTGKN